MIEVLVASVLLIVGVLASLMLLDTGAASTASSLQRDTGNAIAQEVIERASGLQYTSTRNDLTDVRSTEVTATPADRLRASMDPDGDQSSTAPTRSAPGQPWKSTSTWTLRRRSTVYTITYKACTRSDVAQGTMIMGPYDCYRADTDPPGGDTATDASCRVGLVNRNQITQDNIDDGTLTVRLQLLDLTSLELCLPALLPTRLTNALCTLLGGSPTSILKNLTGFANGVLNVLGSGAGIGLCPKADVQHDLTGLSAGIASATEVEATVSWGERNSARRPDIVQSTVIRKPATDAH